MGRGNVCVHGEYEHLLFIDNDDFYVYRRHDERDDYDDVALRRDLSYEDITGVGWYYDEYGTQDELGDIEDWFIHEFTKMFRSFKKPAKEKWIDCCKRVILENAIFCIALEDNQWSMAVELLQKTDDWGNEYSGSQSRLHDRYFDGMKKALLSRLDSVGIYTGAWTSGVLKREEL